MPQGIYKNNFIEQLYIKAVRRKNIYNRRKVKHAETGTYILAFPNRVNFTFSGIYFFKLTLYPYIFHI